MKLFTSQKCPKSCIPYDAHVLIEKSVYDGLDNIQKSNFKELPVDTDDWNYDILPLVVVFTPCMVQYKGIKYPNGVQYHIC
jgi:hypothetical protein